MIAEDSVRYLLEFHWSAITSNFRVSRFLLIFLFMFFFLETTGFINELFVAIATKSYMNEDGDNTATDSPTADLAVDSMGEVLPPPLPQPQVAADTSALREEIVSSSKVGETGKRALETAEEGDREHRRTRRSRSRSRSHSPGR